MTSLWSRFSPETAYPKAFGPEISPLMGQISIILFALLGGAVIFPQILTHPQSFPVDFNYLWGAGQMWAQLESPYSANYHAFLLEQGVPQYAGAPVPFFYPPNAILLIGPFGLLSLKSASIVFTAANLAALLASSFLFARITKLLGASRDIVFPFLLHVGLIAAGWNAGKIIFAYNAPMLITYLGVVMVCYATLSQRSWYLIIGLVITLMKPQIGIALLIPCLFSPSLRRGAIYAIAITGVASLIGLAPGGIIPSLQNFLSNLSAYGDFYANLTEHTSGLGFAILMLTGIDLSAFILLALMIGVLMSTLYWVERLIPISRQRDIAFMALAIVMACTFLPSHNNYLIVLMPVIFWLSCDARPVDVALWAPATLLMMRGWDIAQFLQPNDSPSMLLTISATDTVATFAIFTAVVIKLRRQITAPSPLPHTQATTIDAS